MRKLASIQKIKEIRPIIGADKIEVVRINNWDVVAKKGEFNIGDLCVYFEIDSFLPIKPEYEFLRKSSYKKMLDKEGFRLRTIKLRGVVSQGLALPMSVLGDFGWTAYEGLDITEKLGVLKYEAPIPAELAGVSRGNFPSWMRKTDQIRCQILVDEIQEAIDNDDVFEISIKLDGTSLSIGRCDDDVAVCSRNLSLVLDQTGNSYINIEKKYNILEKLKDIGNYAISGELMGPGVQGNHEQLKEPTFFVFDVFDVDTHQYVGTDKRLVLVKKLKLEHVPILHKASTLKSLGLTSVDKILEFANGKSLNAATREGIVFKRIDGKFSFKAISNKYLLKYDR